MTAAVISAPYKQKCLISQWKDLSCLLCMEKQANSTMSKEDFFLCVSSAVVAFAFTCHKCPYDEFKTKKRAGIRHQPQKKQILRRKAPRNPLATL